MNKYSKKKWCEIILATFIVLFLGICIYKEINRDIPRNRPTVSVKHNENNIETTMGEHTWANPTNVGNSYLAGSSYKVGKKTPSFMSKPSAEIKICFSSAPKNMNINIWKDENEALYSTLEFPSQKTYSFNLPYEKGEYIFDIIGHWGETNNTSHIFRVIID